MSQRKLYYLNQHRIIYKRLPINDKPSKIFKCGYFYENGTHEYYSLFNSRALINTYKSLRWHFRVLNYLNQDLTHNKFILICKFISKKDNGFTTFNISDEKLKNILRDIYDLNIVKPPNNKLRKIIFKDFTGLTTNEKLKIVGKLIGRTSLVDNEAIYQAMLDLNQMGKKITIGKIANLLNCSIRTVHRNMCSNLKQEKCKLNEKI